MNLPETAQLLTMIAAFSNRTVDKSAVIAWQSVLGDVDLADAEEAVRQHYAEHTEWLMPAHIRAAVRDMVNQRAMAARHTGWAPGQAGVPKDQAMPEIAGPIAEGELTPTVRALLDSVRAMLPEGSREALMPRTVAWEREQRAFVGVREAAPNPLYKPPTEPVKIGCPYHEGGGYGFKADCGACVKINATPGERAPLRECVVDGDGHCQTHDRHVSSCPLNGRG